MTARDDEGTTTATAAATADVSERRIDVAAETASNDDDGEAASPPPPRDPYRIGGPGTSLPIVAESLLGWGLCLSCLAVSGYHYCASVLLSRYRFRSGDRVVPAILGHCRRALRLLLVRGPTGAWAAGDGRSTHRRRRRRDDDIDDCPRERRRRPNDDGTDAVATWIPLTTHSRAELERLSPRERYASLLRLLESRYPEVLTTPAEDGRVDERRRRTTSSDEDDDDDGESSLPTLRRDADVALVGVLRRDDACRRLASLVMRPYDPTAHDATVATTTTKKTMRRHDAAVTTLARQYPNDVLLARLSRLWGHLLVLPSLEEATTFRRPRPPGGADVVPVASAGGDANGVYRISLVVPAYGERCSHLRARLSRALETAADPSDVEVVVVDAGGCDDLRSVLSQADGGGDGSDRRRWGRVSIFSHISGGGRGPCLNFGASVSSGRILTFCHSDTTLPRHWDGRIASALGEDNGGRANGDGPSASNVVRANSCAFSFGIDTSLEGLSMPFEAPSAPTPYYPPGIRAVETTANLRTYLYSLPYGDQVLSLHAFLFHFLGGFPDQCLMEDYELVSLLRRRATLFSVSHAPGNIAREKLAIIPGDPALCSPRRWQKFGVLYVTFMNSKFVNLYAGARKMDPDELFQLYYGKAPPTRDAIESPWEVELAIQLDASSILKA